MQECRLELGDVMSTEESWLVTPIIGQLYRDNNQ
jgi:hypothetical protein